MKEQGERGGSDMISRKIGMWKEIGCVKSWENGMSKKTRFSHPAEMQCRQSSAPSTIKQISVQSLNLKALFPQAL